jgi:hypothetical protein
MARKNAEVVVRARPFYNADRRMVERLRRLVGPAPHRKICNRFEIVSDDAKEDEGRAKIPTRDTHSISQADQDLATRNVVRCKIERRNTISLDAQECLDSGGDGVGFGRAVIVRTCDEAQCAIVFGEYGDREPLPTCAAQFSSCGLVISLTSDGDDKIRFSASVPRPCLEDRNVRGVSIGRAQRSCDSQGPHVRRIRRREGVACRREREWCWHC